MANNPDFIPSLGCFEKILSNSGKGDGSSHPGAINLPLQFCPKIIPSFFLQGFTDLQLGPTLWSFKNQTHLLGDGLKDPFVTGNGVIQIHADPAFFHQAKFWVRASTILVAVSP